MHQKVVVSLVFIFLGFASKTLSGEDFSLSNTAKNGEKLYFESHFEDAIPYYKTVLLQTVDKKLQFEFTLRLADCYLKTKKPHASLSLLNEMEQNDIEALFSNEKSPQQSELNLFYLYLKSQAYFETKNSDLALAFLDLKPNNEEKSPIIDLERGLHWMSLGKTQLAKEAFNKLLTSHPSPLYSTFAHLQLAKIAYDEQAFQTAHHILQTVIENPSTASCFTAATHYLLGHTRLALQQEDNALAAFKTLLPLHPTQKCKWSLEVLTICTICCLKLAIDEYEKQNKEACCSLFDEATSYLQNLQKISSQPMSEEVALLWGRFHLAKAQCASTKEEIEQAMEAIHQISPYLKEENLQTLYLLLAAETKDWDQCQTFCQQLLSSPHADSLETKICFTLALKSLEEGWKKHDDIIIQSAIVLLQKTISLNDEKTLSIECLKYLSYALASLSDGSGIDEGWEVLEKLKQLEYKPDGSEIDFLTGYLALRSDEKSKLKTAQMELQKCLNEQNLLLLSRIALKRENYEEAEQFLTQITKSPLFVSSHAEANFWLAFSAGKRGDSEARQKYLQCAYKDPSSSPFAPIAYFSLYSYSEYMNSKKKAIKHLLHMPVLYKDHPLSITATYLIGLYYLKDHPSEEGTPLRHKNLTAAIDAFHQAEITFEILEKKNHIPKSELPYFIQTYLLSKYERAFANFAIGSRSEGGKREIYFNYAESIFKELIQEFASPSERIAPYLSALSSSHPAPLAKTMIQLAELYIENQKINEAQQLLKESLVKYHNAHINLGEGVMRLHRSLAKIALVNHENEQALHHFCQAENAIASDLSRYINDRLDLKIEQSQCQKRMNNLDDAMKLLSSVINENVVSPQRIKAMFLRAEIYEAEGREELALKQLEATARKGGEWAEKAKIKLRDTYGYSIDTPVSIRKPL